MLRISLKEFLKYVADVQYCASITLETIEIIPPINSASIQVAKIITTTIQYFLGAWDTFFTSSYGVLKIFTKNSFTAPVALLELLFFVLVPLALAVSLVVFFVSSLAVSLVVLLISSFTSSVLALLFCSLFLF